MTYIVRQKIRGKTYAYEVKGYWDPVKKQPRQKRRYLGVCDEATGEIRSKVAERDVKTTKEFGSVYLLREIVNEIDLPNKLTSSYGQCGNHILALAMSKVIDTSSLRNISHVMEDTSIPELCHSDATYSSQWLSDFLEAISKDEKSLSEFHSSLIGKNEKSLIYDITTLTSYSKNIDWLEFGDDYRIKDLPQMNLGLVLSVASKLPIFHKVFPGSINDVVTLKNLVAEVKSLGVSGCMFILDRGFFSESNILEMVNEGVDFIMPLPFSTKLGKGYISDTNLDIESAANARRFGKEIYYVIEKDIEIGSQRLYAYIFFNERRKGDEITTFYNRLMDIESALDGRNCYGDARKHYERVAGAFQTYFDMNMDGRVIHLTRKPKAIAQAINRMGKMILLSSIKMAWDEVLLLYRERDTIEKTYDDLKNDLDIMPLRVHKTETFRGLLIVYFVALIIRSLLLHRARRAKLLEKESVESILREMGKLRAVNIGSVWKLTEVSKKQRTILDKMGISVPLTPET